MIEGWFDGFLCVKFIVYQLSGMSQGCRILVSRIILLLFIRAPLWL